MKQNSLICDVCGKKYSNKYNLKNHKYLHSGKKPFSCEICDRKFAKKNYLERHTATHTQIKKFQCNICHRGFICNSDLTTHKKWHLKIKRFFCHLCKKGFGDKPSLRKHLQSKLVHSVKCRACDEKFINREALAKHFQIHGDKPFKCNICHKEFEKKKVLDVHNKLLHEPKVYMCELCGKNYPTRYKKFNHSPCFSKNNVVQDSNVKKYKCEFCEKLYISAWSFLQHQKMHVQKSENIISCSICKVKFTRNSSLKRHYLKHTGEKPYACNFCSEVFTERTFLTAHEELVHDYGLQLYSCNMCKNKFVSESSFINHFEKEHNEEELHNEILDLRAIKHTYKEHYTMETGLYSCRICNKPFSNKVILAKHRAGHVSKNCNICSRKFNRNPDILVHYKFSHKDYLYECKVCRHHFKLKETLDKHILEHSIEFSNFNEIQVTKDSKKLKNKVSKSDSYIEKTVESIDCIVKDETNSNFCLNSSTIINDKENKSCAVQCQPGKINSFLSNLTNDDKIINEDDVESLLGQEKVLSFNGGYSCSVCNKHFSDKDILDRHQCECVKKDYHTSWSNSGKINITNVDSLEPCTSICLPTVESLDCSVENKTNSNFRLNLSTSNEKKETRAVQCRPGKMNTSVLSDLIDEYNKIINKDNVEKQLNQTVISFNGLHSCPVCNKGFSDKDILDRHQSDHISKKCNICFREFKAISKLLFHYEAIHKSYSYECKICYNHFKLKETLDKHIPVHSIESVNFNKIQVKKDDEKNKNDVSRNFCKTNVESLDFEVEDKINFCLSSFTNINYNKKNAHAHQSNSKKTNLTSDDSLEPCESYTSISLPIDHTLNSIVEDKTNSKISLNSSSNINYNKRDSRASGSNPRKMNFTVDDSLEPCDYNAINFIKKTKFKKSVSELLMLMNN